MRTSSLRTNDGGQFSVTPTQGGLMYLFVTLHRKVQPDLWESHNAGLTLEVAPPAP